MPSPSSATRASRFRSYGPTTAGSRSPSATSTGTQTGASTACRRRLPGSSREGELFETIKINGPIQASFALFSFFSSNNCWLQQMSNPDRRNRRRARWPLYHHTVFKRDSGKDQLFAEAATPNSQRCNSKLIIVRVTLDLNPSSEVDMFLLTNVRIPCTPCMLCKFTYIVEIDTLLDNELWQDPKFRKRPV